MSFVCTEAGHEDKNFFSCARSRNSRQVKSISLNLAIGKLVETVLYFADHCIRQYVGTTKTPFETKFSEKAFFYFLPFSSNSRKISVEFTLPICLTHLFQIQVEIFLLCVLCWGQEDSKLFSSVTCISVKGDGCTSTYRVVMQKYTWNDRKFVLEVFTALMKYVYSNMVTF